jgi:pilus assembly protein Flp/PilA
LENLRLLRYDIFELFALTGITTGWWNQREIARMSRIVRFLRDEGGATAIEYGLIAAGISIAIIAVVNGLGTQLNTTFSSVSTQLR